MKKIKIFLASSIEDLREDRLQIGDFFRQLNELYLDYGIHFSLIKCEDYDNSMVAGGKQQEYDREIRDSELVFFLFFRKVGEYTKHEFEVALEAFKEHKKPRIITYFKYVQSIEEAVREVREFMDLLDREMKHYYNTYGHIDTLKLGILMQIKLLQLDNAQIKLENGTVLLNGQPVVKTENVPLLQGNLTLRELTERRKQLQAKLNLCRSAYLAEPTEENEAAFFDTSAELNRVSKKLTAVEQETMVLLTTVAEMTADGRVLTHRQKGALKYFNAGDYAAVRAVLEDEERENELRRAEQRADTAQNEIRGYVEEELLLIRTEKAQGLTEARLKRILASYQKVMGLTEKYNLNKTKLYDYAEFLWRQNHFDPGIAVAEKLRWYYDAPDSTANDEDRLALYCLLGNLYRDTHRYGEAEAIYNKALEICHRLPFQDPQDYDAALALVYNNIGVLYSFTRCFEKAEEIYRKALHAYLSLSARNPELGCNPEIAGCYNNLGRIFSEINRVTEAEAAYGKALEIRIRLAARNPDAYEPDLAVSYNNLGNLYSDTRRYTAAEEAYRKALEINVRLASKNPWTYENDLAENYNNLGNAYHDARRYEAAEEAYHKALEISIRLNTRNPGHFSNLLAGIYNNLGNLYGEVGRYADAEEAIKQALEIRTGLAALDPKRFEPELAKSYYNLGSLYINMQCYEKAELMSKKALEIRIRLAMQDPEVYEPYLAKSYNNLAVLYQDTHRLEKSEIAYQRSMEIYTRLAEQNPDVFEPNLADAFWNLASIYAEQSRISDLRALLRRAQPLYEKLAQKAPNHYAKKLTLIHKVLEAE